MRVTLIVPTLNEGSGIAHVLEEFGTATRTANATTFARDPIDWRVLVVDGASTDDTAERARAAGATVLVEPRRGYGRAYLTGFAAADGEFLATLDGDGTYPAAEVPRFVARLRDQNLDFITCSRLESVDRRAMTTEHRIGNWFLNFLARVAYHRFLKELPGKGLVDSQSGMWIFRRAILPRLRLTQEGMAFSEELKLEVLLNGLRFEEVPIHYAERWGAPKLSSWRDGYHNMLFLVRKRLAVARALKDGSIRTVPSNHAAGSIPR